MVTILSGDLFKSKAVALVCTVNCVGVMGAGIAKEFRRLYYSMYLDYQKACQAKQVQVGKMWVWNGEGRYIICFPTKDHWRNPSKLSWIETGLVDLQRVIDQYKIESVALPALGCNNGGLKWSVVKFLIEDQFADHPCDVMLYKPMELK